MNLWRPVGIAIKRPKEDCKGCFGGLLESQTLWKGLAWLQAKMHEAGLYTLMGVNMEAKQGLFSIPVYALLTQSPPCSLLKMV